jgi:hypothetical protein
MSSALIARTGDHANQFPHTFIGDTKRLRRRHASDP